MTDLLSDRRHYLKPYAVLVLIVFIAACVRLWQLGALPPGVFRDEAEKALNAWFLLQHGVDEQGKSWPLFIKVFGVTTSAIYQYATIPFLAFGGLNEWSARLPAAVVGTSTVFFTWLFCRRVWGWQTAAWAAGLLAISPWHVPLSRWAQQGIFLPLFFVMAAWGLAMFRGMVPHRLNGYPARISGLFLTAICLALAMYTYDPARLFAPLLAVVAVVIWWRIWLKEWKIVLLAALCFAIALSPVVWLLTVHGHEAQARFRFLSVFRPGVSLYDGILNFLGNYTSHFSPTFLVFSGDRELRHTGGVGILNFAELIFALTGMAFVIRQRSKWGWFLISWVVLAPVAASLTREGVPHALRSQMALPAWQILAALGIQGIVASVGTVRQKFMQQMAFLLIMIGALPFFLSYFGSYATRAALNWQYGVKQSLDFLNNPNTQNARVVLTETVVGGRYLAPFYLKMNRNDFLEMDAGFGRYRALPFMHGASPLPLDRQPPAFEGGPMAWLALPGFGDPRNMTVPISAPGGEDLPPVMLIYLNDELAKQVTGSLVNQR